MMRGIVLGLVAVLGLAARAATDAICLEGDYAGHLQDVWSAGNTIWWAHTDSLVKTDLSGRILARSLVGGHHAGLEVRNGRLYTAVCDWNGEPRGETDATCHVWIGEYDAETLARVEMHCLDINDRAGSLCILDDGSFLVGCLRHPALSPTEVKFHHIDANYNLIKTHVVDTERTVTLGIETIHRDGEAIHLFMGGPTVRLDAKTLEVIGKFNHTGGDRGFVREGDSAWFGKSTQRASDNRWESKLVRKTLAWTYQDGSPGETPRTFVRVPEVLTVALENGKRETLNAACILDAWADGQVPSETERAAALAKWGDRGGWRTELVATFDRDVSAESLAFYLHSSEAEHWSAMPLGQDVAYGEEIAIPVAPSIPSYRSFAMNRSGFGCGVKCLSSASRGVIVTLCLRLKEPYSGETRTLARTDFRLDGGRTATWFDSRLPQYGSWPADAALAVGGVWNVVASDLSEVATVTDAGGLALSTEGTLDFEVRSPKTLGKDADSVCIDYEAQFTPCFANDLPEPQAGWKGGVLSALDGSDLSYYGLAKVGADNGWVKLEGPAPTFNGGPVRVRIAVRASGNGEAFVTYSIDGVTYAHEGKTAIGIFVPSPFSAVAFGGNGRLLSFGGSYEKPSTGLAVLVR